MGASCAMLGFRSRVLRAVREFFHAEGYTEVETPVRLPAPAQEPHIEAEPSGSHWLRTSPEFHMKRLLAAGLPKIYQIGPCFRRGERGHLHNPEYTMLEWYRTNTDYRGILNETRRLLSFTGQQTLADCNDQQAEQLLTALQADWPVLSVREEYTRRAGWDPFCQFDPDRFDLDMVNIIEPGLPRGKPAVLIDYPPQCAAFARLNEGGQSAQRWELYINGIEIANAYTELTDPKEMRLRLAHNAKQKMSAGQPAYPEDENLLEALDNGLPECGGIALGIDRLVMVFAHANRLDEVIAFRE